MANTHSERFETARQSYLAQREKYYSSYTEEDLKKANAAFRNWLATSQIHFRPPLPRKRVLQSR
jgi:hypothetical protein